MRAVKSLHAPVDLLMGTRWPVLRYLSVLERLDFGDSYIVSGGGREQLSRVKNDDQEQS